MTVKKEKSLLMIIACSLLIMTGSILYGPATALGADNTGTGDIAGTAGDLTNSNTFTLNAQTLAMVKTAFLSDGTALTSGSNLPKGTLVKFMIYVNNNTPVSASDLSVQDVLDAAFTYQTTSIRVDNTSTCALTVCTGPEEAAIFTNISGNTPLTDGAGDDVVDENAGTINAGNQNEGTNSQLDILANKVWAILFDVKM